MLLIKIFIFILLFFNNIDNEPRDKKIFIPPVRIPQLLSANFGELRIDHFHSGLDIKTQGATGKEVVACADGFVSRISISPSGFGNAIYVAHPSGYSTVYAHLDRFVPEIDEYIKARQYEKKSFAITLFPSRDDFQVRQGDLIAWSGNSGSSGGPHVHFEVRKTDTEKPVNPLLFDFGITDNIKPIIEKLVIYPANRHTLINNENKVKKINVSGARGTYFVPPTNEISISGMAGFGIKAYDLLNDSHNKCAVYSIELKIDSVTIFKYVMDSFAFTESRFINGHIDYESFMRENTYIERAFVLPNDKLSAYRDVVNRGIFDFSDGKSHRGEMVLTDINNNKTVLNFQIKSPSVKPPRIAELRENGIMMMPYDKNNLFSAENISVSIPSGCLYDTLWLSYKSDKGTAGMLSDVHSVHNKYTAVQKAYTLSIKPTYIPEGKESKMLLVQLIAEHRRGLLKSVWKEGYMSAEALSFGRYYVGIDTTPPFISSGPAMNADLTGKSKIRIRINDDLSGIKSYEGLIDRKWALFEYDAKSEMLTYTFDETRITKKSKHELYLKVTDNKDNYRELKVDFVW